VKSGLATRDYINAGCNITADAYNRKIGKRLARKFVWLRETKFLLVYNSLQNMFLHHNHAHIQLSTKIDIQWDKAYLQKKQN